MEELRVMKRNATEWLGKHCPWGFIDHATQYGPGVVFVSTPSHGGFNLGDAANMRVPQEDRHASGWYEEDVMWCKVARAFPELFTHEDVAKADAIYDAWCTLEAQAAFIERMGPQYVHRKAD